MRRRVGSPKAAVMALTAEEKSVGDSAGLPGAEGTPVSY
jgi:hypothetical protein